MATLDTPIYELGYHLIPELEEAEITSKVSEIEAIITQHGGRILKSNEPKKRHLSYPLDHRHYAHFGVIDFEIAPEKIEKINGQIKLIPEVLRHLLIHGLGDAKVLRSLTPSKRSTKGKGKAEAPIAQNRVSEKEKKEQESLQPGQMEKQLENVIESL